MVVILPTPPIFFGKRVSNICGLQEHKIFSLVAHVGMEVTSSLENNLRYMEVCDIFFYLFISNGRYYRVF